MSEQATQIENCRRQQQALANFGRFAFRNDDLQAIQDEAARQCAKGLGVRFSKILRYRATEGDLVLQAGVGWHADVMGEPVARADYKSPAGRALLTKEPVLTFDLPHDPDFELPRIYPEHGIKSSVNVIVQSVGSAPYGILEVDSEREHAFTDIDICFIAGFANVVAEALAYQEKQRALRAALDAKERAVAERDLLARELQHRVRNGLQVIVGQLSQEAGRQRGSTAERGLNELAQRVMTMARTYDHLLGTGLDQAVDFAAYLGTLCSDIQKLYGLDKGNVTLTCSSDPLQLDIDRTTSLGLAINELVANCYEHAFPTGSGAIAIKVHHDADAGQARIVIADDGVGFREDPKSRRQGVRLVRQLVQRLGGVVNVRTDRGTTWEIIIDTRTGGREDGDSAALSIGTDSAGGGV